MQGSRPLPKAIGKCPIKEAIFELRFNPKVPGAAVFGIFYGGLKSDYPNFEQLPILQLPEAVRDSDPNLVFQPHYRLRSDNVLVQIGPRLLSVNCLEPYIGWNSFSKKIRDVLSSIDHNTVISEVTRMGLRYTNVFDEPILDKLKLEISISDEPITNAETSVRTVFDEGDSIKSILQIAGEVDVTIVNKEPFRGSLVDVDVSISGENIQFFQNMEASLERVHEAEKLRFFGLLNEEFVRTLEPVYE